MTPAEGNAILAQAIARTSPMTAPVIEGDIVVCQFSQNGFPITEIGEVVRARSGPGRAVALSRARRG